MTELTYFEFNSALKLMLVDLGCYTILDSYDPDTDMVRVDFKLPNGEDHSVHGPLDSLYTDVALNDIFNYIKKEIVK